jgi:DNA-binding NarL/FixJ family response regulator
MGNQEMADGGAAEHGNNTVIAASTVPRIRVLFVEDDLRCARAFGRNLGRHGMDLAIAENLHGARRVLRKLDCQLDVILLDLHLPDGRGEDLLPDIDQLSRQPGLVIFSSFLDEISPEATSYRPILVPKTIAPSALAAIVRIAANGYVAHALHHFAKRFGLTSKETKILELVARGEKPKGIAMDLKCSMQAVYAHLTKICTRAGCSSYQEAVAMLFQFACHG